MLPRRLAVLAAAAILLHACATPPKPAPAPVKPPPPAPAPPIPIPPPPPAPAPAQKGLSLSQLPGWEQEDHLAALKAFQSGCGVSQDPDLRAACSRARALGGMDESDARDFLEANFRAEPLGDPGLLTGYFAPEYEARASSQGPFTAAVRGKPDDLVIIDGGELEPSLAGRKFSCRIVDGRAEPYPDRAAIEARPERKPLAWMRPEELFFLQIQGSGVLTLPDGRRLKAAYVASNDKPFVGIAAPMRAQGLLPDNNTSGDAIRTWLADHRGAQADAIMRLNPRYVFFSVSDDDGAEPAGAAGVRLTPGRSIAVDPNANPLGGLYWVDGSAPALNGAFPAYRRLVMALDVGGAIKGPVRADLYLGRGAKAGAEAGRVRHTLRLYRLTPVAAAPDRP